MRPMTRQDHIDPLVQKIQKCGAAGCGPNSVQVIFTRPRGYIVNFDPVWVCSSGHCSDYDEIPNLRTPELDPVEWVKAHAERLVKNSIGVMLCDAHAPMAPGDLPPDMSWGQEGHPWALDTDTGRTLMICLPKTAS